MDTSRDLELWAWLSPCSANYNSTKQVWFLDSVLIGDGGKRECATMQSMCFFVIISDYMLRFKVIKLILWWSIEVHIKHIIVLHWLGMDKAHRQGVLWLVYLRLNLGVARTIAKNSSSMPMRSMFFCLNLNNYECWIHSLCSFILTSSWWNKQQQQKKHLNKCLNECVAAWLRMNKINPYFIILELF